MMLILDCLFFAVFFVRSSFAFFAGWLGRNTNLQYVRAFNAPHRTKHYLIVKSCSCSFESIPVTVLVPYETFASYARRTSKIRPKRGSKGGFFRENRRIFPRIFARGANHCSFSILDATQPSPIILYVSRCSRSAG